MKYIILVLVYFFCFLIQAQPVFRDMNGKIRFTSVKSMNMLEGYSDNMMTRFSPETRKLAFKVQVTSFNFTNCSRAVEKAFNEVYMESHKFHWAKFEGILLDTIDFYKEGAYEVKVSGLLDIHGVAREREIPGKIIVKSGGEIEFISTFDVLLSQHNLSVLKEDTERLSETIVVYINSTLKIAKPSN